MFSLKNIIALNKNKPADDIPEIHTEGTPEEPPVTRAGGRPPTGRRIATVTGPDPASVRRGSIAAGKADPAPTRRISRADHPGSRTASRIGSATGQWVSTTYGAPEGGPSRRVSVVAKDGVGSGHGRRPSIAPYEEPLSSRRVSIVTDHLQVPSDERSAASARKRQKEKNRHNSGTKKGECGEDSDGSSCEDDRSNRTASSQQSRYDDLFDYNDWASDAVLSRSQTPWDNFKEYLRQIHDSSSLYAFTPKNNPLHSINGSMTFNRVMEDLKLNAKYRRNQSGRKSESSVTFEPSDDEENGDEDVGPPAKGGGLAALKRGVGGQRAWKIMRRNMQETILDKKKTATSMNWAVLKHTLSQLTDKEKARQKLYERYLDNPYSWLDGFQNLPKHLIQRTNTGKIKIVVSAQARARYEASLEEREKLMGKKGKKGRGSRSAAGYRLSARYPVHNTVPRTRAQTAH